MFIHPWDAALDAEEWRAWVAATERFGVLAVGNVDPAAAPLVVPTHFTATDGALLVHLARPNPVWPHLERAAEVRLALSGDYAYIPSSWRAKGGDADGVPTSYYTSVQFVCAPTIIDDAEGKAEVLRAQLADFQPEGAPLDLEAERYARMLPGLRAVRLTILSVEAKFKYDDHQPVEHRERVSARLEDRGRGLDRAAARQQRRRLERIGDWQEFTSGA